MASLNDVLRVFRRLPGDWRIASAAGGVSRAVRDDGLALDLRLLRGGQLQVEPVPRTAASGDGGSGPLAGCRNPPA